MKDQSSCLTTHSHCVHELVKALYQWCCVEFVCLHVYPLYANRLPYVQLPLPLEAVQVPELSCV